MLFGVSALIGVGNGFLVPTSTGLITEYFSGSEASDLMGNQNAFLNFGGMLLSTVGGLLCVIAWNKTYLLYVYAIIIFFITLTCVPNDYKKDRPATIGAIEAPKGKLTIEVYIMSGVILLYGFLFGVLNTNNSILVVEKGIGDAAIAGLVGSVMSGVGIVIGLIYGKAIQLLKKWALPRAFIISFFGMLIMAQSVSQIMLYLGVGLCGIGFALVLPTGLFRVASAVEQSSTTFAMTIYLS